jgi:hypothetical protein
MDKKSPLAGNAKELRWLIFKKIVNFTPVLYISYI